MVAPLGLDSGELRHQVTIEQNTPTFDLANQAQDNWTEWLVRRAKIETTAGADFIQDQQVRNNSSHVITMR